MRRSNLRTCPNDKELISAKMLTPPPAPLRHDRSSIESYATKPAAWKGTCHAMYTIATHRMQSHTWRNLEPGRKTCLRPHGGSG